MNNILEKDTITAIATPPGKSAIGVVRLSGNQAVSITNKVFSQTDLEAVAPNTIHYGKILDNNNEVLDEVMVSVFRAPKSYTGEDLVEISCHGSMYILNEVLNLLVSKGARLAHAGEFTLRAFLNKKLDLSQAEAVADIIDSESKAAHDIAFKQMRGGYSDQLMHIRQKILEISSLFELELDFAEEDVEFAGNDRLKQILDELEDFTRQLVSSFSLGNALKKGVAVVIAGRPNAGKSTLLNTLLQEERAIISDIPGTTRDFIEDSIQIDGVLFRFIDTAGITETNNEIEKIGINKAKEVIGKADIIIYLFDLAWLDAREVAQDIKALNTTSKIIVVANKSDKIPDEELASKNEDFKLFDFPYVVVSCRQMQGIENLKKTLYQSLQIENYSGDMALVSNQRHLQVLKKIAKEVKIVQQSIADGITKDLISISLRSIIHFMGEITGEITSEEILGNIFSRFCIGK